MRYHLTPEIEQQVLQFIRAGGFDWVAAEAAGIPRAVFERWLARGAGHGRQPYRRFYHNVMQARAQARVASEVKARDKDPRFWLKHGPGRERPGYPGWSNPARAGVRPGGDDRNVLDSPEVRVLLAGLLGALERFPEAHDALNCIVEGLRKEGGVSPGEPEVG